MLIAPIDTQPEIFGWAEAGMIASQVLLCVGWTLFGYGWWIYRLLAIVAVIFWLSIARSVYGDVQWNHIYVSAYIATMLFASATLVPVPQLQLTHLGSHEEKSLPLIGSSKTFAFRFRVKHVLLAMIGVGVVATICRHLQLSTLGACSVSLGITLALAALVASVKAALQEEIRPVASAGTAFACSASSAVLVAMPSSFDAPFFEAVAFVTAWLIGLTTAQIVAFCSCLVLRWSGYRLMECG